ncbi:signal transduction histidine kinase [Microbacterium halimionae]|uniref:histidine kinase n=1 Tax=Microbacterium halimionae TaxID=1526413 RepID=A0A7W3JQD5_9MICO|nr:histidine kinase [Microbacterium halimionae]MBA8817036.1 signal transduction histidine kinase [Microbacterium halimionae]NII94425.1 signal transduction histidine kinase [Microbacterium halimionae]
MIRALSRRALLIDLAVATAFLSVVCLAYFLIGEPVGIPVALGMSLALGMRRLSPALALAVSWLTAILQIATGGSPSFSNVAILVVLFGTAAYGSKAVRSAGLISTVLGATAVAIELSGLQLVRDGSGEYALSQTVASMITSGYPLFVASLSVFLLSWVLGLLTRTFSMARESRRAEVLAESARAAAQKDVLVEQERTRIARDMHDVVAHSLAVVIAQADGGRYAAKYDPRVADTALLTIASTARSALSDVRMLLAQLRDDQPPGPQPTIDDIDTLIDQLRASGLVVEMTVVGQAMELPLGRQLAVYRIVQEALTNALRHGDRDTPVRVDLRWTTDVLAVVVTNEVSPEPEDHDLGGHGLAGMRERAALVGGSFRSERDGRSFVVTARIPVSPESVVVSS